MDYKFPSSIRMAGNSLVVGVPAPVVRELNLVPRKVGIDVSNDRKRLIIELE
jgi:antitoxin component of MazEF toxin-antitoxin module